MGTERGGRETTEWEGMEMGTVVEKEESGGGEVRGERGRERWLRGRRDIGESQKGEKKEEANKGIS